MSTCADAAAEVFQQHRDELGFVNRAQCKEGDLYTVTRDDEVVGAALANHCVQKPQTTLYELAVLPEYRRQGIAMELIRRLARDSPHEVLVAKCPEDLPANEFYAAAGWEQVAREEGKERALNVWEYQMNKSPDLITTGRQDLTEIAGKYGWLRGARLDSLGEYEKRGVDLDFIDLHWESPDPEALLAATKRHRPKYVVAGDYDDDNHAEVNDRADKLHEHAENVIIVPHSPNEVNMVPDWAVVGYSTPTKYAGTDAPVWEYRGRDVHILGGTIDQIREVYGYLADDVVSIDNNSFHRGATEFAKWWAKSTPSWNKLSSPTPRPENAIQAYENTMLNLTYTLREEGIAHQHTDAPNGNHR